jgi:formylglycine-generating enzyme
MLIIKNIKFSFVVALLAVFSCKESKNRKQEVAPQNMVFVKGNEQLKPYFIDISPVTVAEFDKFVKATNYKTQAHEFGNGAVFLVETGEWKLIDGADYWYPFGKDKPKAEPNHPVTQVSWNDAVAYAKWAKKRLPTYEEMKWAAMNDDATWNKTYAWGDNLLENGKYKANVWQGSFPYISKVEDGFQYTSPVGYYGKSPLGLTDLGGNVWQWCQDWDTSIVADTTSKEAEKVEYGGSFLCDKSVCHGYKVGNTSHSTPETSLCHVGFRCVKTVEN